MCNLINTYIHTREDQCEWHRMTRMTGPDCVVMCNLINTYIHTTVVIHVCIYSNEPCTNIHAPNYKNIPGI